jgi:nucleotide-binding universal stress UspA family protein
MSTILVGVDSSERSKDAIAFARQIASASGATVVLASVYFFDEHPGRMSGAPYRAILEQDALALVSDAAKTLGDLGEGRVRTSVIGRMSAAHGLHDLAATEDADLIVVGSSNTGRGGRVFPGSTAERLLHGAGCPVAVVPSGYTPSAHAVPEVGVAFNGSREGMVALNAAIGVARATHAGLRVIHVLDRSGYGTPALMGGPSEVVLRKDLEERERAWFDIALRELPGDVPLDARFLVGDPSHELALQTETLDLLITGSRGYGPVRAVLTGGVTGPLLRSAACPVVVLPRGVDSPLGKLFASETAAA